MNKILGIKGDRNRGNEVIALLQMLGGEAVAAKGYDETAIYVIPVNGIIDVRFNYEKRIENYAVFTLDEFLEKYPFKVNDIVIDKADGCTGVVCEMKWDEDVSDMKYCVVFGNGIDFGWYTNDTIDFYLNKENKNLDKKQVNPIKNVLAELLDHIKTTPKEELEREFEEIKDWSNVGPTIEEFRTFCECVNKKPKYPTTYEECCKVMGITICGLTIDVPLHYSPLLVYLTKLLITRNAYWKIASEQMGLGKPWEPEYVSLEDNTYFTIHTFNGEIDRSATSHRNAILAFPTIEMRDAFYENFKDLIERCKELL